MKALLVNEDHQMALGNAPDVECSGEEVKIEVRGIGINRADLLQKAGNYPPPPDTTDILGLEVSGVVVDTGPDCKIRKIGDKVMALLPGGGYAEYVTVSERSTLPIPANLGFVEAAGIAEVFLTAYQALVLLSDLREGENVLIHGGASGVGTAAIQLAKTIDANVIVTAGSSEKIRFCKDLGADHGINYRDNPDFDKVIKNKLRLSIDVLVDYIGGSYLEKNISVLGTDSRWVLLAMMGGAKAEIDLSRILMKRIKLMGSTLRARDIGYKSELVQGFEKRFLNDFGKGLLRPIIDSEFNWEDANEAHERMLSNQNTGKIILTTNS